MTRNDWVTLVALLGLACGAALASAAETAVVLRDRVNVRGQPSLAGETFAQLRKGEAVTVLEVITPEKPKAGEPAKWAKITLPAGTAVWVHSDYLDTANHVVKARRLNLRARPGEHHSVVGRLERGAAVEQLSTQDMWIEIKAPTNAFGFVAANLIEIQASLAPSPTAAAATTPQVVFVAPTAVNTNAPPASSAESASPVVKLEEPTGVDTAKTETQPTEPQATAEKPSSPAPSPMEEAVTKVQLPPEPEPTPPVETPLPRRIIRREGIVGETVSIQAPTYYQLNNVDTERVMDYLHSSSTNISLKKLRGKRVIVTGEEAIDPRWPRTPVLEIETLEVLP